MNDGSGYAEETVDVMGDKAVTYNVTTPSGKTTLTIPEERGFYIINLKTDTVVGSQQILGKNISSNRVISQEELKGNIDSLTRLTMGQNVSAANHNYFILPNQVVKVSDNMDAKVFGPFTKIPATLDADKNGNAPEIYKFYTNTEMRQLINNFKKMTF
jgi:predicted ATP-grasp superfamily ATP-dependent carboligase